MSDRTKSDVTASQDAASVIARELSDGIVRGLATIIGEKSVFDGAKDVMLQIQSARRILALSLVTITLTLMGVYGAWKFGIGVVAPTPGDFRGIQATFILVIEYLLLYFVAKRSKQYLIAEIKEINVMLPYERKYNNGKGPGHNAASDYTDKYWSYSQVDMAVFGCLIATTVTAFYDLLH